MSVPGRLPPRALLRVLPKPTHIPRCTPSSSTAPFSTCAPAQDGIRIRPSPEKVAERLRKIERKRAERAVRSAEEQARRAEQRATKLEREVELMEKVQLSEELTADVPELTDRQLESIYQGLMLATPEQLAQPLDQITGPSSAALPPPGRQGSSLTTSEAASGREAVWDALEARLDRWQEDEGGIAEGGEEEDSVRVASALAEKLRLRREGKQPERAPATDDQPAGQHSPALEPSTSRAAALLNRLVDMTPPDDTASKVETKVDFEGGDEVVKSVEEVPHDEMPTGSLARGIAVREEWRTLLLACAEEGHSEAVLRGLSGMQRALGVSDSSIVTELIAVYGSRGRSKDAIKLSIHAKKAAIPLSVLSHHHLIASLVPTNTSFALSHLHSLEAAGHTPLQETYTLLIRHLLSPKSPLSYVQRGWDLFAHSRLVAHAVPSAAMFSAMIAACARPGVPASPERAIDLFTEMTADNSLPPTAEAYNGLIRACAREGSQKWYLEALKMLRRMLRDNIRPTRSTFHAVLEGAVGQGDLPRARWILVKMVAVGAESAPNASTLGLVLRTYANYEVLVKQHRIVTKWAAARGDKQPSPAASDAAPDTPVARQASTAPSAEQPETTSVILDLLEDSSLHYPGPLPTTADELVAEASKLLHNAVPMLSLSATSSSQPVNFPEVVPTAFLLDSFLRVLCAHAPFEEAAHFYANAYETCGVEKTGWTFEAVMERCGTAKNRAKAEEFARAVFAEWEHWAQDGAIGEGEAAPRGEGLEAGEKQFEGVTSRNVSRMWSGLMHVLARNYNDQEALALLQTFIARYPPSRAPPPVPAHKKGDALPRLPSPVQLSNALYGETVGRQELRPYLLFEHLKLLHLRLAAVEDRKGLATVKGICMAYEGALKGLVRPQRSGMNKAEARKREKRELRRQRKEKRAADGHRG